MKENAKKLKEDIYIMTVFIGFIVSGGFTGVNAIGLFIDAYSHPEHIPTDVVAIILLGFIAYKSSTTFYTPELEKLITERANKVL